MFLCCWSHAESLSNPQPHPVPSQTCGSGSETEKSFNPVCVWTNSSRSRTRTHVVRVLAHVESGAQQVFQEDSSESWPINSTCTIRFHYKIQTQPKDSSLMLELKKVFDSRNHNILTMNSNVTTSGAQCVDLKLSLRQEAVGEEDLELTVASPRDECWVLRCLFYTGVSYLLMIQMCFY